MKKPLKPLPSFSSEDEAHAFWATHDSADYINWDTLYRNPALPQLKPSTRAVSIRLPESLISDLKTLANKKDVPYQSLVKLYLADKVREEREDS